MRGKVALAFVVFGACELLGILNVSAQVIQTVAGGQIYVNCPATQVSVNSPTGIAYAPNGTVYMTDGNRVDQLNPSTGLITTVAGGEIGGYSGDGGPATSATLNGPFGVAVDDAGNLYIADTQNSVIRMVSARTGIISTVAGNGANGHSYQGLPATSTSLGNPTGVALDGSGNVYIADAGNQAIYVVSAATGLIDSVAGAGYGYGSYSGDGGLAKYSNVNAPQGLAFDNAGNLYIADSGNQRVRMVSAATGIISTVAGSGAYGYSGDSGSATNAALANPTDVALDGTGNLYIADANNQRIRMVSMATGNISTVAGNGTNGYSGDGGPATGAALGNPIGVAVDVGGNLYIADTNNQVIRTVGPATGTISTVVGNGTNVYSGDGEPATSAALNGPYGVAVDGAGNLYISDQLSQRIRMVSAATGIISTIAGNGTYGYAGDGESAISGTLGNPTGVAVDGAGNVYIADTGNLVIRMISALTGTISTVAGSGTYGFSGDGGPATNALLSDPTGVAVDGAANLYIADTNNQVIRMVSAASGTISTIAGNGTYSYSGDGGPATGAAFANPAAVAVDGAGNLYIADQVNQRIRMVSALTGIISTVAGNGTYGYSGDGGPATGAELSYPTAVAVDGAGNLYIADQLNQVIRMVSAATGIIATVAGNGTYGYSGDGGPAMSAELGDPTGVAVSYRGNLYVADNENNLVREVTGLAAPIIARVVTPVVTGTLGGNGWYTSNVQVSWTVSGGTSPIVSQIGCGTVTISADTPGQTLTCSATSASGGTTSQSVKIKRDAAPPTISVSAPTIGATYTAGSTIASAYSCADAQSGLASCIGTVATGAPISTAGIGSHTFTVIATDLAGNVAQTAIAYNVVLASQTIAFGAIASQRAGTTLALQGSASSGLPVTFTSSSPGVCTVSGSTAALLSPGTCTISASQGGSASYSAALPISQSFTVTAKLKSDTVTLGISSGTETYGAHNSFAIGPSYTGSPAPTGTVTLYDNGVALVTLALGSTGLAYYTANPLNVGGNVMTATYSGDAHFAPGVSAPVSLNVMPVPVKLIGTCWGGTPYKVANQCLMTVSAATASPPTGSITYSLDGVSGTFVVLRGGSASFVVATLPITGVHKLTIAYPAQGNYAAATNLTEFFTTAAGQTQLLISPSSFYLAAGSRMTLTVTASSPLSGVPTGSITVYDNGKALGAAIIGGNGVATYPVASITRGTHTYTARYAATANYAAATSDSETVTAH